MTTDPVPPTAGTSSQTLSRGIRLLEILAESDHDLSIAELSTALGVHRSVAYRLLRTLELHNLVTRDASGLVTLGTGLAALASGVDRDLQRAALPELTALASELGMTCLLAVMQDTTTAVTLASMAPRQNVAVVSYRPGHRHPVTRGGPGKAILLGIPESAWPADIDDDLRAELGESRRRGYASSNNEVVPSLRSVAVPLTLRGHPPASLAVVHVELPEPEPAIAARLTASALLIARALGE